MTFKIAMVLYYLIKGKTAKLIFLRGYSCQLFNENGCAKLGFDEKDLSSPRSFWNYSPDSL
jgi:hypothetical protein